MLLKDKHFKNDNPNKNGLEATSTENHTNLQKPEPEPGQIVAHGDTLFGECFRCMLELTEDNHYLVQEFSAKQGEKRSEPYILTSKDAVYASYFSFWKKRKSPIEGAYILWTNQGQKHVHGHYQEGSKHGRWEYWSVDGQKIVEENYYYGQLNGPWLRWSYGVKFMAGSYSYGKKTGLWKQWWFNGQIFSKGSYYAGMPHGEWIWWRRDGVRFVQGLYEAGRKVGIWLRWNSDGKLVGRKDYTLESIDLNDWLQEKFYITIDRERTLEQELIVRERIRVSNLYDNRSNLYSREFLGISVEGYYVVRDFHALGDEKFTDPYMLLDRAAIFEKEFDFWSTSWRIQGSYTQWHSNGRESLRMEFKDGIRHGLQTNWDEIGQKIIEKNFVNNTLNGYYYLWYPNGQLHEKRYYSHNARSGLWVSWWDNGQKKCQGNYQNDLLHGCWNWWHKDGSDMAQGHYERGLKSKKWQWWGLSKTLIEELDFGENAACISEWLLQEHGIQTLSLDSIQSEEAEPQELGSADLNHVEDLPIGYRFTTYDVDFINRYERIFLGVTPEGFDVVQDFYWDQGDRLRTAPYMLQDKNRSALLYYEIDDVQRCGIEGKYQQWHPNGCLEFKAHMKNGRPVGQWQWWNSSGELVKNVDYDKKNDVTEQ